MTLPVAAAHPNSAVRDGASSAGRPVSVAESPAASIKIVVMLRSPATPRRKPPSGMPSARSPAVIRAPASAAPAAHARGAARRAAAFAASPPAPAANASAYPASPATWASSAWVTAPAHGSTPR